MSVGVLSRTLRAAGDVTGWGAVGDGVTDDTAAIQAAVDSLTAGGTLELPAGRRFKIGTVTIPSPRGITIHGGGTILDGTLLIGPSTGAFKYGDGTNLVIDNLSFTRSADSTSVNALELRRITNVTIARCRFGRYSAAVYVVPQDLTAATGAEDDGHVSRLTIDGCMSFRPYREQLCQYLFQAPPSLATSYGGFAAREVIVNGCSFNCYVSHVYADGGIDGLICTGNTFQFPSYAATTADRTRKQANIYVDKLGFANIAHNNLFEAGFEGIHINRPVFLLITGNHIGWPGQRQWRSGIRISGGSYDGNEQIRGSIVGNMVSNPTGSGIDVQGASAALKSGHLNIADNYCWHPGDTARTIAGLFPEGTTEPAHYAIVGDANTTYLTSADNVAGGGSNNQEVLMSGTGAYIAGHRTGSVAYQGAEQYRNRAGTQVVRWGTGSPEGVVTGRIGDLFLRTDGGATTTLYVKTSGTDTNTGWTPK